MVPRASLGRFPGSKAGQNVSQIVCPTGSLDLELKAFIVYREGGNPKIKKVFGLAGEEWEMRDGHMLIGPYVRSLSVKQQIRMDGHNETVPDDCLVVGSNESPDRFMMIVHKDNITSYIPLSEI